MTGQYIYIWGGPYDAREQVPRWPVSIAFSSNNAATAAKASGATALNVLASPLLQQIAAVSSLARPS
jgi:hypothetical protein